MTGADIEVFNNIGRWAGVAAESVGGALAWMDDALDNTIQRAVSNHPAIGEWLTNVDAKFDASVVGQFFADKKKLGYTALGLGTTAILLGLVKRKYGYIPNPFSRLFRGRHRF